MQGSIAYHIMLNFLQRLGGWPSAKSTTKLFAFYRAVMKLSKPAYDPVEGKHQHYNM